MSSRRPRWRSVCYPLLLVGSAIFFSILYRIIPSMFLLLVKSFPIALCTALLLGILLIHGGQGIPPPKEEEEGGRDVVIKNQESVCNAVSRRKNIGQVEEGEWRADFMALAEMNHNVAHQLGARFETTSCLANDAKYTCRTPADVSEPTGSCRHDPVHRRDASSDSENDGEESSAASDADLLPLLDELDPLLDPEATDLAAGSNSDACSQDRDSNDDSMAEEAGIQDDEDEDDDDDDEEEEAHEEKEDESKAAVTWTADDQSNLVHLGNSELERNSRLESAIERRRSMKITEKKNSMPIMEEIARLNTPLRSSIYDPRKNPFDLPYDADDAVPDSAPSVLLQGQNPFHQVDMGPQESLKDALFTRHESFTVGASFFDHDRDRFGYRFKPYFSTETGEDEGILSDLHRQLSDMNVSTTADSDAASSVTDQEDAHHQEDPKLVAESNDEASFRSSNGVVESTDMEHVTNDVSVEQSARVLGGTEEDDSTSEEDQELDLTVSDAAENLQVLDEDTETSTTRSPSKSGDGRSEEQTSDAKDEMDNAFSHDSAKEDVDEEEYGNMNNEVPVYDSSPSSTDKSRSIFSTQLDEEILVPADNTQNNLNQEMEQHSGQSGV